MARDLKNEVAIVVGASSGMGRATAAALARAGARVIASARREDRLIELQSELAAEGLAIDVAVADASNRADVDRLIASTVEKHGRVDLLVYATGTNIPQRSIDVLSADDWDLLITTNLSGAFHCTQAVLPTMRANGGGLIVYLSTAAVQMPDVSGVAYQASKHGITGLAHGTRVEEKKNGIRTTVIFPGLCRTEILAKRPKPTPPEVLELALEPTDVADAVLFVAQLDRRAVVPEMQLMPSKL